MKLRRDSDSQRRKKLKNRQQQAISTPKDRVVGWFTRCGLASLCDGDALIVAGSEQAMREITKKPNSPAQSWQYLSTTFDEIHSGMQRGGAYAFDEQAYNVFLPLAQQAGIPVKQEDFSDPGPLGMHFVRIRIMTPRHFRWWP